MFNFNLFFNTLHLIYATIFNFNLRKILHQNQKKNIFVSAEELKIHNTYFNVKFQLEVVQINIEKQKECLSEQRSFGSFYYDYDPRHFALFVDVQNVVPDVISCPRHCPVWDKSVVRDCKTRPLVLDKRASSQTRHCLGHSFDRLGQSFH